MYTGEKIVLRLLKKNKGIQDIFDLGFPRDEEILKNSFDKRNSITVIAAPTGEGKTTTLYSILDYLNRPEINVTTLIDMIIKTGMKKRASDIHIEPLEETIRVRYRIDRTASYSI